MWVMHEDWTIVSSSSSTKALGLEVVDKDKETNTKCEHHSLQLSVHNPTNKHMEYEEPLIYQEKAK